MYKIIYFTTDRDEIPARDFILSLPDGAKAKVAACIDYVAAHGHLARRPYSALLRDKIYELRTMYGRLELRMLYFFDGKDIVLTHGFLKKTNNVPEEEIERAVRIMRNYQNR
jgi:phage-related protein